LCSPLPKFSSRGTARAWRHKTLDWSTQGSAIELWLAVWGNILVVFTAEDNTREDDYDFDNRVPS